MSEDKYGYQKAMAQKLLIDVEKENILGTVLAGAVGSGKTQISIHVLNELVKRTKHPIIWLSHAQTVLKNQTIEIFQNVEGPVKPNFSVGNLQSNKQVLVTIPQELCRDKRIQRIDYLLIDESHEWFASNTVLNLVAIYRPKLLLLTGTPSMFVNYNQNSQGKKFKMHFISGEEMIERGLYSKVELDLIRISDETKSTPASKAKTLVSREEEIIKFFLEHWEITKLQLNKSKIMIACKDVQQAANIANVLKNKNLIVHLSTAEHDPKSIELEKFKETREGSVLIVVDRASLGMNFMDLNLILDLSETWNINRCLQLVGRIFRKNINIETKYYWRISLSEDWNRNIYFFKNVLGLLEEENMKTFNGRTIT